jgi:CTP:molybdopterin cytidylyltransferase MocA
MDKVGDSVGLLLAAGAGRRMGRPKALVDTWLVDAVTTLREGGCARVTVVLGAAADEARPLLAGQDVEVVVAADWDEGMGASLRTGLQSLATDAAAALVTLVDLPDVGSGVVRRLLDRPVSADTLARATYDGTPGHPVLIGRDHWAGVIESAIGDQGARYYLGSRQVEPVECGDLATGRDVDDPTPDDPTPRDPTPGDPTRDQPAPE